MNELSIINVCLTFDLIWDQIFFFMKECLLGMDLFTGFLFIGIFKYCWKMESDKGRAKLSQGPSILSATCLISFLNRKWFPVKTRRTCIICYDGSIIYTCVSYLMIKVYTPLKSSMQASILKIFFFLCFFLYWISMLFLTQC